MMKFVINLNDYIFTIYFNIIMHWYEGELFVPYLIAVFSFSKATILFNELIIHKSFVSLLLFVSL